MKKLLPKSRNQRYWLMLSLLGCASAQLALGQDSSSNDDDNNEDLYELSPFVIETDENVGYLATSTLAGSQCRSG